MSTAHVLLFAAIIVVPLFAREIARGVVKVARRSQECVARCRARRGISVRRCLPSAPWHLIAMGSAARYDDRTIERVKDRLHR